MPPRALILHNVVAPYRLPVFEAVATACDLTVYFCRGDAVGRRWSASTEGFAVRHVVLPHRVLRLGGRGSLVLNPGLLRRLLAERPFDVYLAGENSENLLSVLTVLAVAKSRGRAFVCWSEHVEGERTFARSGRLEARAIEAYRRVVYRAADGCLAYGSRARDFLLARGVAAEKITVGGQVMPPSAPAAERATKESCGFGGKVVVLALAYLSPRKGLDVLITAFRALGRRDAVLVIAGSGESLAALQALAGDAPDIAFSGYVEGAAKARLFAVADLLVLPSLHDPWGLVVNEAMAHGLPVVVSDGAGCAAELVRDNGFVVPAGDAQALCAALRRLLDDASLRRRMGAASRRIIARYDLDYARDTFTRAIRHALGERPCGS